MKVKRRELLPAYLAVAAVYAASTVISFTWLRDRPELGIAVVFDLTVTAAAAFWLLAVRPGHAKPAALLRVVVLGLALARLLVGMSALGVFAVVVELAITIAIIVRVRRIVRRVRAMRAEGHGLGGSLDAAFREVIPVPAVASALAMEVTTVIFAFTGWFRTAPPGFAMHRRSGTLMIGCVLAALVVIEAIVTHIFLVRVSPTLAIVASALSAYGLMWLLGVVHAIRLSPLRMTPLGLVIERGVMRRVIVPYDRIAAAAPIEAAVAGATDLSYEVPNVLLTLASPVSVQGVFGRTTSASQLTLSLDDRDAFLAHLALK